MVEVKIAHGLFYFLSIYFVKDFPTELFLQLSVTIILQKSHGCTILRNYWLIFDYFENTFEKKNIFIKLFRPYLAIYESYEPRVFDNKIARPRAFDRRKREVRTIRRSKDMAKKLLRRNLQWK